MIRRSNYGKIDRRSGMGGFLNPPTHPSHAMSVHSSYGDIFSMSLESAAECEWLNPSTRYAARGILKAWKRPAIESPEVQDWIKQVLGYFRNCYRGEGPEPECWNASNLRIIKNGEPLPLIGEHAGVHLIRKYYPEFTPAAEHLSGAYWGQKPAA